MSSPTERFSDRVNDYIKYRPSYPAAAIDLIGMQCGLSPAATVADVGAGTGILTRLLLQGGARVFCVEPNSAMRAAAERMLGQAPNFTSVAASAEETTLPTRSIDLITVAQAFHWFDAVAAAREFRRVLRPSGWVVLLWNHRHTGSPFAQEYDELLYQYAPEYHKVTHHTLGNREIAVFFHPGAYKLAEFENRQHFDFHGLKGRMLSSSYSPAPDHANYAPLVQALRTLFDRFAVEGKVTFPYITYVYYGQLQAAGDGRR